MKSRYSYLLLFTLLSGLAIASRSNLRADVPQKVLKDPSFPQPGTFGPATGNKVGGVPTTQDDISTGTVFATLADSLTVERKAGLWWDYARDVISVATRLSNPGRTTLLVPVNSAMMKMSHKPHQNPDGTTPEDDDQAIENVDRFIAAHIIPSDVNLPTEKPLSTLLKGLKLDIVKNGDGWRVQPGDIDVVEIKEASNGRILYLDGVVSYE